MTTTHGKLKNKGIIMSGKQINIKNIDPSVYNKLKKMAKQDGRTVSSLIRLLIVAAVKEATKGGNK